MHKQCCRCHKSCDRTWPRWPSETGRETCGKLARQVGYEPAPDQKAADKQPHNGHSDTPAVGLFVCLADTVGVTDTHLHVSASHVPHAGRYTYCRAAHDCCSATDLLRIFYDFIFSNIRNQSHTSPLHWFCLHSLFI